MADTAPTIRNKITAELARLGIQPDKAMGQNFLIEPLVYQAIIHHLAPAENDVVVEVGPGLGTLTEYLAQTPAAKIIAVEKDRELAAFLKNKFAGHSRIDVLEDDILAFKAESFQLKAGGYLLVGNIPYYLTSHLIRTVLENWPRPKRLVFTVQLEVAQRMTAKPPHSNMLAVLCQYYCHVYIPQKVGAGSFYPRPTVSSAIVVMETKDLAEDDRTRRLLFKLASAGFSHNRKQLVNNLSESLKIAKSKVDDLLRKAGFDPRIRAETLSIEDWLKLSNYFAPILGKIC